MRSGKGLQIIDPVDMCDYILSTRGAMSHLKLQKLIYYIQAYHLAYFNEPIFEEDFEAWVHGPVCRKVFNKIRDVSLLYNDIKYTGDKKKAIARIENKVNGSQFELIQDVLEELSNWSGLQLESATHSEAPWKDARKGLDAGQSSNNIISKESMRIFYKAELNVD